MLLEPLTDSKDVAIRVTHVHLSYIPRLVRGRPGDLEPLLETMLVDGIDVVHPDRHPDTLVLAIVEASRRCERALPATTLAVLAQEYLALA